MGLTLATDLLRASAPALRCEPSGAGRTTAGSAEMDRLEVLRRVIRRRDDTYKAGDIEGYLANYAPDITVYFSGSLMKSDEVRKFIRSLFEGGGKTLDFQIADPDDIQLSEYGDAAVVSYPWRERFRYADGRETDSEYYEMDVWYRQNGEWKLAHMHVSTVKEHPVPGEARWSQSDRAR